MLMISIIKADGETPFQFTKRRLVLKFPITAFTKHLLNQLSEKLT